MKKDSKVKYSFAYHDIDKDKVDELILKADYKDDDKDTDILYEYKKGKVLKVSKKNLKKYRNTYNSEGFQGK